LLAAAIAAALALPLAAVLAGAAEPARPGPARTTAPLDLRTGLADTPVTELAAAASRGDKAEIARWAERLGTARLARLLQSDDRGTVIAALEGTRQLDGNVRLLSSVTRLLNDSDAKVAERAAVTMGELLRADRLGKLLEWEISAPEVADACSTLARTADRAAAAVPLRVAALDALAEGHAFCRVSIPLGTLSGDVWPEVRRAALLAPQIVRVQSVDTIGEIASDRQPQVAGAAATVWCRHRLDTLRKTPLPEVARQRLGRMRALVMMEATAAEDAMEMLPCLALSPNPDDKKAFETARKRKGGQQ
jgi:hypothetical protein